MLRTSLWLPRKSQSPRSGLPDRLVPPDPSAHLPTPPPLQLHRPPPALQGLSPQRLCQRFPLPRSSAPSTRPAPPSSSGGLCSNVTSPARPSQTARFLSPASSSSPAHSHADTVCLFSVCLHPSLGAPRRWGSYSRTFPGVDAEPGTVSSLQWLPDTLVSVSQGPWMLRTGSLVVFGSQRSLHWSRHSLFLLNDVVIFINAISTQELITHNKAKI